MSKDYLSKEIYIIEGQEYIFDYDKSRQTEHINTLTYTIAPLYQNGISYEITFRTFQNSKDEHNEFEKQTLNRNNPLHGVIYATIQKDEVEIIDENPFVKVEITYEVIKYITNLDEMAKSGIIEDIRIKKLSSQTPH
ncbi:hypothetical protein V3Y64_000638 [Campylobacter upsaliensis]|uniref:Uncharacterized protein n=1 Tax=Campylobacter upsaliensis TaxID=28080 RepID=A0A5L8Q4H5_CAMUP|nr:hypothetical protein [Campylobacter upsaliensis]EAH5218056.1 hypothetical protein [Campylobacter upsaliensis]EAH5847760.1 hypothetical protein [Campylobacter upsaliensis]EAH5879360.1 hypothetical protein [Campylobacter upsaliensis]EAH5977730.1 hypothetical protein [Campylobacter upsaliensis]EAH6227972.1 hypothetical protein [Campylobacter upsaliensis]